MPIVLPMSDHSPRVTLNVVELVGSPSIWTRSMLPVALSIDLEHVVVHQERRVGRGERSLAAGVIAALRVVERARYRCVYIKKSTRSTGTYGSRVTSGFRFANQLPMAHFVTPVLEPGAGRFRQPLHIAMQVRLYHHPVSGVGRVVVEGSDSEIRPSLLIGCTRRIVTALQAVPRDSQLFQHIAWFRPGITPGYPVTKEVDAVDRNVCNRVTNGFRLANQFLTATVTSSPLRCRPVRFREIPEENQRWD